MAWTDPNGHPWAVGELVSAADMNTYVRLDLEETAPDKVTTAGDIVQGTGNHAITRLAIGADYEILRPNVGGTALEYVMHPLVVRKTADETVNNSAALQNDDHLVFAIAANETWIARYAIMYSSNTTADFKFTLWSPGGGATGIFASHGLGLGAESNVYDLASQAYTTWGTDIMACGGAGAVAALIILEMLVVNSSTPGNVTLQWAQNTADASDTKVLANSFLVAQRIA